MKIALNVLLLAMLFTTSCQHYTPPKDMSAIGTGRTVAHIKVIPWELLVDSGDTEYVYVTILDQDNNPVPNRTVNASIENPFVAIINGTAVTDANGVALFTATGLGVQEKSTITFTSDGLSYSLDVWNSWYRAFSGGGY